MGGGGNRDNGMPSSLTFDFASQHICWAGTTRRVLFCLLVGRAAFHKHHDAMMPAAAFNIMNTVPGRHQVINHTLRWYARSIFATG